MKYVLAAVLLYGLIVVSMLVGAASTVADMDKKMAYVRPTVCEAGV